MPRATWFCIDIECSGPVPQLYDMLSLGAVPILRQEQEYRIGEPLYVEIRPTAPRVDERAMAVNGLDLERLRREGLPLAAALERLREFVAERCAPGSTPVFVGHNAPFDWSFLAWGYAACGMPNPFGYKGLCTKALASGVLGLHWLDSNKEQLAQRLDLPEVEPGRVHRADYDAWYQAHILVQLLKRSPCADS